MNLQHIEIPIKKACIHANVHTRFPLNVLSINWTKARFYERGDELERYIGITIFNITVAVSWFIVDTEDDDYWNDDKMCA